MSKILVTGANGQLGNAIRDISSQSNNVFVFTDINELDITNEDAVIQFFNEGSFDFAINCAAYTAVDKAESDIDNANLVNITAVENLAKACERYNCLFVHVSTDYVFDGEASKPVSENSETSPLGVYGRSKLDGEIALQKITADYLIIRTSWLYYSFGNNFVKTIIRLASERDEVGVIDDQYGTPTYAGDLAKAILKIVDDSDVRLKRGVYHYSNTGICTWYDFAKEIIKLKNIDCNVKAIGTKDYPTPVKRPKYSVLDKTKITTNFNLEIPNWKDGLKRCIDKI